MNEQIRISPVRVIDQENNQLGILPTSEALNMARTAGLDLVEVSPTETPPVCRIMDYGKFKYTQKKKQKQSHAAKVDLKEVRLRPKTDDHDRMIKVSHALEFLEKGHKVQFTMLFKGRERFNMEFALGKFKEIIAALGEKGKVIRPPTAEGRRMTMVVVPARSAGASAQG
ncbi:MAG: translation initiation factor IF-3 [Phycisphaerae bacterium]|nr:translation initiation factor IF-3 [Phycisphaerae bacterium]